MMSAWLVRHGARVSGGVGVGARRCYGVPLRQAALEGFERSGWRWSWLTRSATAAFVAVAWGIAEVECEAPPRTSWLPAKPGAEAREFPPPDPNGRPRVAFQGELGAYSHAAVVEHFSEGASIPCPVDDFEQLLESVRDGEVECGMIPVENSLAGTIHKNYDLLLKHQLHITGEVTIPISHCLLANPGAALEDVKTVRSHPVALEQCERFIKKHGLRKEVTYDTAGSAKIVAESGAKDAAAIASKIAGQRYGLEVLAQGVQDEGMNFTRFLLLSRRPAPPMPGRKCVTCFLIALPNKPGALVHALTIFSMRGLNLSKLESRPMPSGELGEEIRSVVTRGDSRGDFPTMFVMDVGGSTTDVPMQNAIRHLQEESAYIRVMGSYPIK